MNADLEALASQALDWMRAQSAETQAEIYLKRSRDRVLARRDGRRDVLKVSDAAGLGVRVIRGGKTGFASSGTADPTVARELWRRAVEQLPHSAPDPARQLPFPASEPPDPAFAASLRDESLFTRSWEILEQSLATAEASSAGGRTRSLRSELEESRDEVVVANTHGVFRREFSDSVSASVSVCVEEGSEVQIGEGWRGARRFDAVDFSAAGAEAARRAMAVVGSRRIRAGRRPVVFEPWVGAEFLETISDLLSAEEVESGRSLLAGRLGKPVASGLVSLRDDPRRSGGPASAGFDDEGVSTRDKTLVERGVLREFFHDSATASRAGTLSNGCGYRAGFDDLPGPGPSNFFLAPGAASREALIADTRDGLLALEVLGIHMIDPVSGEFSVGISGLEILAGAEGRPFKGAMISGNLLDLLARVDLIADDLVFYGNVGAPTFRVSELDIT